MRLLLLIALAAAAASAQADLYRYRDPDTGQTKLTNLPPPWLAKPGAPAPRTDVIREPAAPPSPKPAAAPAPAEPPGLAPSAGAGVPAQAFELERQRKLMLRQLIAEAPNVGTPSGKQRYLSRLGDLVSVESRMDKLDPAGRKAREAERSRAIDQCAEGFAQALQDPDAQLEFAGEMLRWLGDRIAQCARGQC
jgi:hypothetical protein